MIIEFCGLFGAGKSTIARTLAADYNIPVLKIETKSELFWYNAQFLLKHPLKFTVRLIYVFKNSINFKMLYYKLMNSFLQTQAKFQKAIKYPICIIDQGYVQNIGTIFEKKINEEQMLRYLKYLIYPDKLIFFTADRSVLDNRLKNRGYFTRQFLDEIYLTSWKDVVYHNYHLFSGLINLLPCKSMIIDGDKSPEEICRQILKFIYMQR